MYEDYESSEKSLGPTNRDDSPIDSPMDSPMEVDDGEKGIADRLLGDVPLDEDDEDDQSWEGKAILFIQATRLLSLKFRPKFKQLHSSCQSQL